MQAPKGGQQQPRATGKTEEHQWETGYIRKDAKVPCETYKSVYVTSTVTNPTALPQRVRSTVPAPAAVALKLLFWVVGRVHIGIHVYILIPLHSKLHKRYLAELRQH